MEIELYTDGGCRGNGRLGKIPAGIGVVLLIPNKEPDFLYEKLNFNPNTNNKAEIYAMIRGLDLMVEKLGKSALENLRKNFVKDKIKIYSDSNYVIQGLTSWINSWRANNWFNSKNEPVKNKELWEILDRQISDLSKYYDIELIKVKGHSGNKWNEKCDELANRAMNMM